MEEEREVREEGDGGRKNYLKRHKKFWERDPKSTENFKQDKYENILIYRERDTLYTKSDKDKKLCTPSKSITQIMKVK